jgi:hypothetical protein
MASCRLGVDCEFRCPLLANRVPMVGMKTKRLTTGVTWTVHRLVVGVEGLSPVRSVPPTESHKHIVLCRGRCST